jgi:hypothetical protein
MMDEFTGSMYADNVRAAHQGLFEKLLVFGTITFGYKGEPIEGQFTKRRRPRCLLVIDPETARWVVHIFTWYVVDRVSVHEIVRRLNANADIPLPPRCTSGAWTRTAVMHVLRNSRYRGLWKYGVTEAAWISSKDYARQMPRDNPLREIQVEELRIVSDDLWFGAQKRLLEDASNAGRRAKDRDRKSRRKLLNGIFWCPEHDRPLYVGGSHGKILFCPTCRGLPVSDRPLFSFLNREMAARLTCQRLAELVRRDEPLATDVIAACQREIGAAQQPDPAKLTQLRKSADNLAKSIDFVLRNPGGTPEDEQESAKVLKQARAARAEFLAEIHRLEAGRQEEAKLPSPEEVRQVIANLGDILASAALDESEEQRGRAREIVQLMTGGRICLYQQGDRKAHSGWLQGRFRVRLLSLLVDKAIGITSSTTDEGIEVVIDYRALPARVEQSERAKELYDQGLMNAQIAQILECKRNWVTKLLRDWFTSRGQSMPDGRTRRSTLKQKHLEAPPCQQIADEAMALYEQGLLLQDIADRLGRDRNTITNAIKYAHAVRGLKAPDGRTRRKSL